MKGILRSKYTLIVVYLIMAGVCVYLNLTAESLDISNVIVSAALFAIVLGLFGYAFRRFTQVDKMIAELTDAADTIRDDFGMKKQYLWRYYRTRDNLFTDEILRRRYAEYRSEIDRLELLSGDVFRCDIEDYINQELIDDTISRNVLNLMSGTMTGLGILGTFIGLTLGLQQFNTGTAEEITQSIAPLIQGIKVAFHTSIYGMVFSLIFSFIYKNKMDQATEAMDRFLDAYEHYVIPDTKNESQAQMLAFQKTLADGMTEIGSNFSQAVGDRVSEIMTPQMDRMNDTVEKFAYIASRAQVEGVNAIVDKFLDRMNLELNGAFSELGKAMKETANWEMENRSYMKGLMKDMDRMSSDLIRSSELVQKTMENMAQYVNWMNQINDALSETLTTVNAQLAMLQMQNGEQQKYMAQFVDYTRQISASSEQYSNDMAEQLATLRRMDGELAESTKKSVEGIYAAAEMANKQLAADSAAANNALLKNVQETSDTIARSTQAQVNGSLRSTGNMNSALTQSAQDLMNAAQHFNRQTTDSLNATLEAYDKSLARIIGQLNATASRLENSTNKVPRVVENAYEGMQKAFDLMARETAAMVRSMDQVRKELRQMTGV